jgi:hypothetical protein
MELTAASVGPFHHAARRASAGGLTRLSPLGPTAGSHWMALSRNPQVLRKGSSCAL